MLLPRGGELERRGLKGSAAAGLVVLGLLVLATVVGISTVRGITAQTAAMADSVSSAIDTAVSDLDADQEALESARGSIESPPPVAGENFLTHLTDGLDKPVGLASGLILGALIMYYLLKDGSQIRRSVVAKFDPSSQGELDWFHRRLLRDYGREARSSVEGRPSRSRSAKGDPDSRHHARRRGRLEPAAPSCPRSWPSPKLWSRCLRGGCSRR